MKAKIKIISGIMGTQAFGINDKGWKVLEKIGSIEKGESGQHVKTFLTIYGAKTDKL